MAGVNRRFAMSRALQIPPARVVIANASRPKPISLRMRLALECSASILDLRVPPGAGLPFKHFARV